jgi:WD40 repeat protein
VSCCQFDEYKTVNIDPDSDISFYSILQLWVKVLTEISSFALITAVSCCQFDGYKVISGSADSDLRIWETSSGFCTHVLQGHAAEVVSILTNM